MMHWYESSKRIAVGGIWELSKPSFRKDYWVGATLTNTTEVPCSPLTDIVQKHTPDTRFFDFYSLDVEGGELSVLESVNFEQIGFGVILVEMDSHDLRRNMAIRTLLEKAQYRFLYEKKHSAWFVNADFHS